MLNVMFCLSFSKCQSMIYPCFTAFPVGSSSSRPPSRSVQITVRTSIDEKLGFDGAVAALGKQFQISQGIRIFVN